MWFGKNQLFLRFIVFMYWKLHVIVNFKQYISSFISHWWYKFVDIESDKLSFQYSFFFFGIILSFMDYQFYQMFFNQLYSNDVHDKLIKPLHLSIRFTESVLGVTQTWDNQQTASVPCWSEKVRLITGISSL